MRTIRTTGWGVRMAALLLALLGCSSARAWGENWTRFRGENGSGVSAEKGVPVAWSPGDYAWNIELPGVGHSSPVIWGERLFVTSAVDEGALRYLFCLDAATGELLWERVVGMNRSHKHQKSSWASSTPATDGQRVYVAFADRERQTLAAYDFDGRLVWRRLLGAFESQHGQGVSPIVYDGMVILPNDQDGPSSVVAVNAETGETVWSTLRSFERVSYATPIIIEPPGSSPQLIVSCGAMGVTSLDPHTGRLNWLSGRLPQRTVHSPVYGGGLVFQSCGQAGKGVVMVGVDPTGTGDVSATHVKFSRQREIPYVPTPVVYDGHLYLWNDNGVVACLELPACKEVWTKRIGGNFSGSPICIDGKLYCMSEAGDVHVLAASPEFQDFGKTPLGDPSHATPAVANGRLYLRSFHRLACLEAQASGR